MKRATMSVALLALMACADTGDPAQPDMGLESVPEQATPAAINLMVDFVPGDPTFERNEALNVSNVSQHQERRSHTTSRNCLSCHQQNGPGRGLFTIAGTLLDEEGRSVPNAVLKLFATKQAVGGGAFENGKPFELADEVMSIEVDGNGNFFTTEPIPNAFEAPLYPQFFSSDMQPLFKKDGKSHAIMGGGVQVGGCNFCHGLSFPIVGRRTSVP